MKRNLPLWWRVLTQRFVRYHERLIEKLEHRRYHEFYLHAPSDRASFFASASNALLRFAY